MTYITHIDEANYRVNALEKQLGLAKGEFIENLDEVNARIAELETRTGNPQAPPAPKANQELAALKARHLWLCQTLGTRPEFQATCNTVEDYRANITVLEARLKSGGRPTAEVVAPAQPFNATIAFYRTGNLSGLAKAIGAAIEKSQPTKQPVVAAAPRRFNAVRAHYESGKATGLAKAMGLAAQQAGE
jgi:hypothetical protein